MELFLRGGGEQPWRKPVEKAVYGELHIDQKLTARAFPGDRR
jgi:hypothetical protein